MAYNIHDILCARDALLKSAHFLYGAKVLDESLYQTILDDVGKGMQPNYAGSIAVFPPEYAFLNVRRADGTIIGPLDGGAAAGVGRPLTPPVPGVCERKNGLQASHSGHGIGDGIGNGNGLTSDATISNDDVIWTEEQGCLELPQEFLVKAHATAAGAEPEEIKTECPAFATPTITATYDNTDVTASTAGVVSSQWPLYGISAGNKDKIKNENNGKEIAPVAKNTSEALVVSHGLEGLVFAAPAAAVAGPSSTPAAPNNFKLKGWVPPHLRDKYGRPLPGVVSRY
ncbi:hypothetical protein UCREL1_4038 [Eutypa lata UCREL1]|uniref:Uncharacterized protein n=1 Tax=Eutypa lata (strain UCR-EL1) TaxID=1287681 RepID=M7TQF5_EUTLA|nr:hypothetical protein UCREL1_4038 [Eutypa lata UCREL1]